MKNVLILGGFGFIGSNLIEELLSRGSYRVVVFEFKGVMNRFGDRVTVCRGDYNNTEDLEYIFRNYSIDTVFHLISTTVPITSNDNLEYDIDSNLVGTIRLLKIMVKYHVKRLVFLSSGGTVYGKVSTDKVDENHPTNPISAHGITKLSIEKYIQLHHHLHDLNYLILRVSNPFGPYHVSDRQGFVNVAIRRALNHEPLVIWGNGSVVRDYIYVKDVVRVMGEVIEKGIWNNIINIGTGIGYSINHILQFISELPLDLTVEYSPAHKYDVPYIVLNNNKLKSFIDYEPTEIRKSIRCTYEWMEKEKFIPCQQTA
jgi:UDP-glucose 4-epimerase